MVVNMDDSTINDDGIGIIMPHHQNEGIKQRCDPSACQSARLSVYPMPRAQNRYVLELRLLQNTNRKPRAGSRTQRLAWPYDHCGRTVPDSEKLSLRHQYLENQAI